MGNIHISEAKMFHWCQRSVNDFLFRKDTFPLIWFIMFLNGNNKPKLRKKVFFYLVSVDSIINQRPHNSRKVKRQTN